MRKQSISDVPLQSIPLTIGMILIIINVNGNITGEPEVFVISSIVNLALCQLPCL